MRIQSGITDQYICSSCKEEKSPSDFGVDRSVKRGRKYECRSCVNQKRRGRYQAENRTYHLRSKYNITPEKYAEMLHNQLGLCVICGQPGKARSGGGRAKDSVGLYVDHSHIGGEVRGLLCHKCNVGLGLFGDDPARLESAAAYVRGLPVEYVRLRCVSKAAM